LATFIGTQLGPDAFLAGASHFLGSLLNVAEQFTTFQVVNQLTDRLVGGQPMGLRAPP